MLIIILVWHTWSNGNGGGDEYIHFDVVHGTAHFEKITFDSSLSHVCLYIMNYFCDVLRLNGHTVL